jgi:hypothetical protein
MAILKEVGSNNVLFQQDQAPLDFQCEARGSSDHHIPGKWIGGKGGH